MDTNQDRIREGWHLDKRVPVALILTMVIYGITAVWMFANLSSTVGRNTIDIANTQKAQKELEIQASIQNTQLGRIEEQIIGLRRDITSFLRGIPDANK